MLPEMDRGTFPQTTPSHCNWHLDLPEWHIFYVVNVFPKDITPWSGQDSNPGPSAPDPDALYIRPQRPHGNDNLYQFW